MIYYLFHKIIALIITLLGVLTLVFFSLHMTPGDPVEVMLGDRSAVADRQALETSLGLDKPIHVQYINYLSDLLVADLGESIQRKKSVSAIIGDRIGITFQLACISMLVAFLIAFPLGYIAARYPNGWQDRLAMVVSLAGISIPNFVLGPILVLIFSLGLRWLPTGGHEQEYSWLLPSIALGTAMAAMLSRMLRSSLLNVAQQPFVLAARAKGLTENQCWLGHILPNALLPVVTVLGLQLGTLLGGAVVVEIVFAWPGIGSLFIEAIEQRDYPLAQGCMLVITFAYVGVNMLVDICYMIIDPRIRLNY